MSGSEDEKCLYFTLHLSIFLHNFITTSKCQDKWLKMPRVFFVLVLKLI